MIQNCDSRPNHSFEGGEVAFEVRNQQFDSNSWIERAYPKNRLGEMTCAAVGQVVAIYRGDNDVVEAEISHYQGNVAGLLRIKRNPDPVDPGSWTWTEWAFDAVLAAVALEAETEALVTADAAFAIVDGLRTVSPGTREFDALLSG